MKKQLICGDNAVSSDRRRDKIDAVKDAKPKPNPQIELPPEDVPFDAVIRRLLAAPPLHDPRSPKAQKKPKVATKTKRARS